MSRSLPEMGTWDSVFDETYLETYLPSVDPERTHAEALGAASLAELEPGAEVLDCPTGFGRHALVLAEEGYRVTGLDRSETLLAEAVRRRGETEWPRFVRGDYRELPFEDASFDAVLNLFSSLGYLGRDGDLGVLREFRRVLRPAVRAPHVGSATGRLALPRGAHARLDDGDHRHVPSHRLADRGARRAALRPPRVLREGVGGDAPRGGFHRGRRVRCLGRRDPHLTGRVAPRHPRALS
jgi:SAM-dependent methyltransferase